VLSYKDLVERIVSLRLCVEECFSAETAYPGTSPDKPASSGHCALVSLIVEEQHQGEIRSTTFNEISHWFNRIFVREGFVDVDLTGDQFGLGAIQLSSLNVPLYRKSRVRQRSEITAETANRYALFAARFDRRWEKFITDQSLPPLTRPTWPEIWMEMAQSIARRSVDPNYQVGCVIVTDDNTQILSLGFNGDYKGGPNQRLSVEPGCSGFIHAEVNALIKMDYNNPKTKIMYVTLSPCRDCATAIINANINRVVYTEEYRDLSGLELLKSVGIEVSKFKP
jgi:dCMP deaminase